MKKALLLMILPLVGLELVTRFVLFPASKDYVQYVTYDAKAAALTHAGGLRVAIIGNSAAGEGIDRDRLETTLTQALQRPVRVEMFIADGSEIVTWHAMLQRYFWSTQSQADVYIFHYFRSLADTPDFEFLRVGMFFTSFSEWPYYLREQLQTLPQRIEFVLSSVWATYGARDRIRDRVLRLVIPGYQGFLGDEALPIEGEGGTPVHAPRFDALERILLHIRGEGAKAIVAAFPLRASPYQLDAHVIDLAHGGALGLLDMREISGLTQASYANVAHLVPAARATYTEHFGAALAPMLKRAQDMERTAEAN